MGFRFICISLLCVCMVACASSMDKTRERQTVCKELRYQLIWNSANGDPMRLNGGTGNQMQATEQRASTQTLEKNYHDEDCFSPENGL